MKRNWMFVAMAFAIATASISEGMAQVQRVATEVISMKRIWPDPVGTFTNIRQQPKVIGGKLFACTVGKYISISADTGNTWTQIGPASGLDLDLGIASGITEIDSGQMLIGGADWLYRSTNGGTIWTKVRYLRNDIRGVCSIFRTKGDTIFVGGWGLIRSTDNGNTWTQILEGGSLKSFVNAIVQMPSGKLIAGLDNNAVPGYGGGIVVSNDGGVSWSDSNNGLPSHKDIECLAAASSGGSKKVYAAIYDRGIYISEDEGANWKPAPGSIGVWAHAVAVYPVLGTYAGFSTSTYNPEQLYKEAPGGVSWIPLGFAGKALSVLSLGILDDSRLLVGTSDGLWLVTFQVVATPVEKEKDVITSLSLSQNYPNPFNPSTTIEFSVPKRSDVNITIWNAIGQKVETLVDGEKEAGNHRVVWNAGKYPSGIYFYCLQAGDFKETKKTLLVK